MVANRKAALGDMYLPRMDAILREEVEGFRMSGSAGMMQQLDAAADASKIFDKLL